MGFSFFRGRRKSQKLNEAEFLAMCSTAEILEQDAHGLKVLKLPNGDILKVFRIKHFISSAYLYSYARRFCKNAERLRKHNVPTVTIKQLYHLAGTSSSAVMYAPLPGQTMRELVRRNKLDGPLLNKLGAFIAQLHDLGIYFRSLHFGNIVLTPENRLGLIDIADMRIFSSKLSCRRRLRNFHHFIRIKTDLMSLEDKWSFISEGYLQESGILGSCRSRIEYLLTRP